MHEDHTPPSPLSPDAVAWYRGYAAGLAAMAGTKADPSEAPAPAPPTNVKAGDIWFDVCRSGKATDHYTVLTTPRPGGIVSVWIHHAGRVGLWVPTPRAELLHQVNPDYREDID